MMDQFNRYREPYAHGALASLQRRGYERLRVCCLRCRRAKQVYIWHAMDCVGPGADLLAIARRARCTACGARGAHVDLVPPPDPKIAPAHFERWRRARLTWVIHEFNQLEAWPLMQQRQAKPPRDPMDDPDYPQTLE